MHILFVRFAGKQISLILGILFILILSSGFSFSQTSSTWWVHPTGLGSQSGADSVNATTLSQINNKNLQPGDFIYFIQGRYTTQLRPTKSGSPGNLITFMANPTNTDSVWISTGVEGAFITNVKYIRLKGLGFKNNTYSVFVRSGTSNIFLDSLTSRKTVTAAFWVFGAYAGNSPATTNLDSVWIRWNNILVDSLMNSQTDGISAYWFNSLYIIGNSIKILNTQGDGHNDGIQTGAGSGNLVIANNYILNLKNSASQITMLNMCPIGYKFIIYNNVAVHKGTAGKGWANDKAYLNAGEITTPGYAYVIHNTTVGNERMGLFHHTEPQIVKNNIWYTTGTGGVVGVKHPFDLQTNDYNYNIYYSGGQSNSAVLEQAAYSRTLQWMRDKGHEANGLLISNVMLSDIINNDFTLNSGSPAKNAGANLQGLVESWGIDGVKWEGFNNPYVSWSNPVPRGNNPTIGAWEFDDGTVTTGVNTNTRLLLQGPFENTSMQTTLHQNGIFPASQPYNTAPWNYSGNESLSSGSSSSMVDWVLVELRNGSNPSQVIARRAAILKNDGTLLDTDGSTGVTFNDIQDGSYYVAVFHRNHLAVMSASPIQLTANSSLYDFTTGMNKAYGTTPMADLGNGKFGLFAGDGDGNGGVTITDRNDVWLPQNGTLGYLNGDFNLDGGVTIHDINLFWNLNNGRMSQLP